jgi:DNA adenine methylase
MTYPGGKNGAGVYQKIINLMPPHDVYIEPFLGGGAVMRLKRPAKLNIGIDLVASALSAVEASIARDGAPRSTRGAFLDLAGMPATVLHGHPHSANPARPAGRGKNGDEDRSSRNGEAAEFRFIEGNGIDFLYAYDFKGSYLVYCDPPYLMSTRSGKRLYEHEMSDADHRRLLRVLQDLPCYVMLSGYLSEMYSQALRGWSWTGFPAMTRGGQLARQTLWYNFPAPVALHDYSYLGGNFRERERIKRKKVRWTERLKRMPTLERQALLSAIAEPTS